MLFFAPLDGPGDGPDGRGRGTDETPAGGHALGGDALAGKALGGHTIGGHVLDKALAGDALGGDALGGKARSLRRLRAAGLPTPSGFVLTDALFRALREGGPPLPSPAEALDGPALERAAAGARALEAAPLPAGFEDELSRHLAALGAAQVAVRSSFAAEDDEAALAAGVYESILPVPGRVAAVAAAARAVLASAIAPGAIAYARATSRAPAAPPVCVLVHAYVTADAAGTAAFDPATGDGPTIDVRGGPLTPGAAAAIARACTTLAAAGAAIELEWAARGDEVVFLQLRPHRVKAPVAPWPGFADLPPGARAEAWRWDAAHNPLPLSPAQAGLVALVDARCRIGHRQRALGGYLFYEPGGPRPPALAPVRARARFEALRAELDARLAALGDPPLLEEALELFIAVYEPLLGVVQPAARRARAALEAFLDEHAPGARGALPTLLGGVPSIATERARRAAGLRAARTADERRRATAAYLALFADEAATWDVAAPTRQESLGAGCTTEASGSAAAPGPQVDPPSAAPGKTPNVASAQPPGHEREDLATAKGVDPAASAARAAEEVRAALPEAQRPTWEATLALAREAAALGEDDDWLYARAQAPVRRALLALGARLVERGALERPDDVFFLPLEVARALAAGAPAAPDAAAIGARAAAGRAAHAQARRTPPPLATTAGEIAARSFRGHGTGGRALGRVFQHERDDDREPPPDAILVARTLLPTELPLLTAAALITETGGPLDHVAAQARERGLPAVVGAPGVTAALRDGELVLVDADAGLVVRLA